MCGGTSCDQCDSGYYSVTQCPQEYIGGELIQDINLTAACKDGVLLNDGGLLNQSQYWFELKSRLEYEQSHIEREQADRRNRR